MKSLFPRSNERGGDYCSVRLESHSNDDRLFIGKSGGKMNYLTYAIKNTFSWKGRATRKQFWLWKVWFIVIYLGLNFCVSSNNLFLIIGGTLGFWGIAITDFSITVRRVHDINQSAQLVIVWFVCNFLAQMGKTIDEIRAGQQEIFGMFLGFLGIVCLVLNIIILVKTLTKGDQHDNQYGKNPYSIQQKEVKK